jgi:undecaprenyl-diphosphatase
MNTLVHFDQQFFFFINNDCHTGLLDKMMPYWRSMYFWLPLYTFFVAFIIEKFKKNGLLYLLVLGLTVGVSDTISSKFIKKSVQRARPCHDQSRNVDMKREVKLLVRCGSGYSFPSSHATNHFAVAFFIIWTFARAKKWLKWTLIAWATSIAFGQVYVGVHYPLDIVCGGILGASIGRASAYLYNKYFKSNMRLAFQ